MINDMNNYFEELNSVDEEDDWDEPDYIPATEEEIAFGTEIIQMIQSIIDSSESQKGEIIEEEFTSNDSLYRHFKLHCLADDINKKSKVNHIYYDFTNKDKYRIYADNLANIVKITKYCISSLYDTDTILRSLKKLFEGQMVIKFDISCGLHNNEGNVKLGIHSFSSNITKNYTLGNTIDILVLSDRDKIITLYPVDAHKFESRFNNILHKYSNVEQSFDFNVD